MKTQGGVGMTQGCRSAIDRVECPLQEGLIAALGQGNKTVQGCLQTKPRLQTTGYVPAYALPKSNVNTATTPCTVFVVLQSGFHHVFVGCFRFHAGGTSVLPLLQIWTQGASLCYNTQLVLCDCSAAETVQKHAKHCKSAAALQLLRPTVVRQAGS